MKASQIMSRASSWFLLYKKNVAQSAGIVEYTDSFSMEEYVPAKNKCHGDDSKHSDNDAPVIWFDLIWSCFMAYQQLLVI